MDSSRGISEGLRLSLRSAVAARMLGELRPESAVALGTELVAAGSELAPALELAIQPSDRRDLRDDDVWESFNDLCDVLDLGVNSTAQAGWIYAQDLAQAILDGALEPGIGAGHLWVLWEFIGEVPGSDPLDMLQLQEAWEGTVGSERVRAEDRIRASAASVVADADAALAAMNLTSGFDGANLRPQDVMPLFLRSYPGFLRTWFDVRDDHQDAASPGGRLNYLDVARAAKHLTNIFDENCRDRMVDGFLLIEQMHNSKDAYVRELATIGFLEDIQNFADRAEIDPVRFEEFLGPVSRRWWRGLEAFWNGGATHVKPVDG